MLDAVVTVFSKIGEAIIVLINVLVLVISRIWVSSCGVMGPILTLVWMLGGTLVVTIILFVYTINKTQSGIELFSASMMGKFIIFFVVIVIFIVLVYITNTT